VGDSSHRALQALVRWDPAGFARRELEERRSAHLPPASRLASLSGPEADLTGALAALRLPPGAEVLGPVPVAGGEDEPILRAVVRVPRAGGSALSATLAQMQAGRSARKLAPVRVQVDPVTLG
jgi:primosomal protein N' (replication factor Y)